MRDSIGLLDRLRKKLRVNVETGCPCCGIEHGWYDGGVLMDRRIPSEDSADGHLPDCEYVALMEWEGKTA